MRIPQGYETDPGFDPAEDLIGPFYYQSVADTYKFAFVAEERHCNLIGIVHGGVLMTFADFSACIEATERYKDENCVTISFNSNFVSAGRVGELIECNANVTRKTGSMVFVTGEVYSNNEVLLTYSTVIKRLRER
jgi:acyl-coenzyme A thioesterase 13|tara:strand:+ start:542 stop:946 length:405 start_codon:yes stop_codon:yes gene_type:complete